MVDGDHLFDLGIDARGVGLELIAVEGKRPGGPFITYALATRYRRKEGS